MKHRFLVLSIESKLLVMLPTQLPIQPATPTSSMRWCLKQGM
jgi:hypothetical protein